MAGTTAPPNNQQPPPPRISTQQKRQAADFVLNELSGKEWELMGYLLEEAIAHPGAPIGPAQVLAGCPDGPATELAVKSAAYRLRPWLDNLFETKGREKTIKVTMANRGYELAFDINRPQPKPGDLVQSFWEPYLTHARKTRVIYPEPLFYRDRDRTYLRNQRVRSKHDIADVLGPYLSDNRPLTRSFSFVPAGAVAGMLHVFEYFQKQGIPLAVSSIRPDAQLQYENEHLIVLGSPGTMPHITQLEGTLPLRTTLKGYWYKEREYLDDDNMGEPVAELTKFAVLTRRTYGVFHDRLVTVISGAHGRSAEGLAGFLFDPAQLKTLAAKLSCDGDFPRCLQALFQVHMTKTDGEAEIHDVHVEEAIPEPRTSAPPKEDSAPTLR